MVAGFRLVNPNMSYVNVSTGAGSCGNNNSNIVLPVPDEEMNDLTSARSSIRGNILRGNDGNLLPDLLGSMPELRPVIMGGPSTSYDQQQTAYDQQQYYDCDDSLSRSLSTFQSQRQSFGGSYAPQQPQARAHNNNIPLHLGSGPSGLSHPADLSTLGYGTNSTNGETSSATSSSSFSNSPNNQLRLRVANLPRASTSFGSSQLNCTSYVNPDLPRSYSIADSQSYLPSGHLGSSPNNTAFGIDNEPRVTIIRTTSTIEYASGSSPATHPLNNFSNNESHLNGGPMHHHHPSGMGFQHQNSQQSVFMSGHSPLPQLGGQEVGGVHRRAHRQARQRATINAASGGSRIGAPNPVKVVEDLLKNQETLVKENEDLKRKLQLLVSTFNDEQKLNKVLKCLEDRRKAAHSQSLSTS